MRSTVPREVDVLAGYDEYFEDLDDPRAASKTRHPLSTVVMIALLGTLCGAESWVDLADFAEAKQSFLATFLDLSEGVPGKDTFRRVFEALSPHAFRRCFQRWIGAVVGTLAGKHLAIDGKTLRGALAHRDAPPLHLVHAWVVDNQALFTQMAGEGKGRELDALLPLFSLLDLRGSTVTIDALGCQREVAEQLVAQKAEYLLSVKDNQPTLHAEARQLLQEARDAGLSDVPDAHARTEERGHGRHEVRAAWVVNDVSACPPASTWPGAKSLVLVERTRTRGEETETEAQVYISSVKDLSAAAALRLIRNHWSVENGLHWTLDVAFREDHSRIHSENGAQNFSLIRRIALHALKRDTRVKRGIRGKQKNCGWDHDYLLSILHHVMPLEEAETTS